MSPRSKKEYLKAIYLRYKYASKKEKSIILNEFCINCGYHRKHATRLLRKYKRFARPEPEKRGRPSIYDKAYIKEPLKRIWLKVIFSSCLQKSIYSPKYGT